MMFPGFQVTVQNSPLVRGIEGAGNLTRHQHRVVTAIGPRSS